MSSFLLCLGHNRLTGVSTFKYTLALALRAHGHEVAVLIRRDETPYQVLREQLAAARLLLAPPYAIQRFTHVVCSDVLTLRDLARHPGKKWFVAHGLGEPLLEPSAEDAARLDHLFCVSRFMHRHYAARFPQLATSFLPNVIDTARFAEAPINRAPRMVLVNDRRSANTYFDHLLALGKKRGVMFIPISELNYGYSVWEMENLLPKFDLVLAYGRSAYEAMSCGRNVVIFGQHGGDGFVTPEDFAPMFDRNCSGWGTRKLALTDPQVWDRLDEELARFSPEAGHANRALAIEHLDVERHLDELLRYA